MTVPRASQICCLSLNFVCQIWVCIHYVLLIFGSLVVISAGVFRFIEVNFGSYEDTKNELMRLIDEIIKNDAQSWLATITILMILIIICHYCLNGIKKNIPQNLLPFTFINAFAGITLIVQNISIMNEFFCIGSIYCFAAICTYSFYDKMLITNMKDLETLLQEASQSNKKTSQIALYPYIPPPYTCNDS